MEHPNITAVSNKTLDVLARAEQLYGVSIRPTMRFDIKGATAGRALCNYCNGNKQFVIRYNPTFIVGDQFNDMLTNTVPHECAHLVCFANPALGRAHDMGWKRVCLSLGGNGKRCHDYEIDEKIITNGWNYVARSGKVITVSNTIHLRLQAGKYIGYYKNGKENYITKNSLHCKVGEKMPTVPNNTPAPTTTVKLGWGPSMNVVNPGRYIEDLIWPETPVPTLQPVARPPYVTPVQPTPTRITRNAGGQTKSSIVRGWIAEAKRDGRGQAYVIAQAMNTLGMAKSLASKYVTENWPKV